MTKKNSDASWLGMLRMELSLIDEFIEPDTESEDNEAILGVASDEVKRLWTYYSKTEEIATRTLIDAKYCKKHDEKDDLMKRAFEMKLKAEMARSILFLSLRDQFGIWNPTVGIGIRAGFQITTFKDTSNPLLDLLRGAM